MDAIENFGTGHLTTSTLCEIGGFEYRKTSHHWSSSLRNNCAAASLLDLEQPHIFTKMSYIGGPAKPREEARQGHGKTNNARTDAHPPRFSTPIYETKQNNKYKTTHRPTNRRRCQHTSCAWNRITIHQSFRTRTLFAASTNPS